MTTMRIRLWAAADKLMQAIEHVTEPRAFGADWAFPIESDLRHAQPFQSSRCVFKGRIDEHNALIKRCSFFYLSDAFKGSCKGVLHLDDFIPRCRLVAQGHAKRLDGFMVFPHLEVAEADLFGGLERI